MSIKINHIAIVVSDIEGVLTFWRDALGLPLGEVSDVPSEAVRIAFLEAGEAHIELLEPTSSDSGVAKYLEKRGPGMHHICLEVPNIEAAIQQLRAKGVELINETPRERDGRKYAFIHPKSAGGVMVELYESL